MEASNYIREMMSLAIETSRFSKDPSTKVGAVAALNKRVIGTGRNGFPPGVDDSADLYSNREIKHLLVQHAEENLISICGDQIRGGDVFVTFPVCNRCAGKLIVAGVKSVYAMVSYDMPKEWLLRWNISVAMFQQTGVLVHVVYDGMIHRASLVNLREAISEFVSFQKSNSVL